MGAQLSRAEGRTDRHDEANCSFRNSANPHENSDTRTCTAYDLLNVQRTGLSVHHTELINLLHPTCHVMHQQFNIQQLYVLPKLYLCVLYLSDNKQRLVLLTA